MTPERGDPRIVRLLDALAIGLFAAQAALRLSLRGGDESWGANLTAHLLIPLSAAVWLSARALERRLPWRLTGFEIPLAALSALSLITSFGAPYRLGAFDGAAGWCAAVLAVPLAVHVFGPRGRSAFLGLIIAVMAVVVLYGAIQYVQLGELKDRPEARMAVAAAGDEGELAGRMGAREPWSTFNKYPNTFGGFLVLALPLLIGAAMDSKSKAARLVGFAIAAVGIFGLCVSGSLGAGVASVGAVLAFAVLLAIRRRPEWRTRWLQACGAALVLAAILVATGPLSPNALARKSESMAIRDVYWDAAVRVAKEHPFGVGLNNFQDYYYEHKDDRQEEVRQVHNDYLQILVELGIPGLLAFLGLLALAGFKALGPATTEPAGPYEGLRIPLGIGLALGWLTAFGFQGAFGDFEIALLLAAAGLGTFRLFSRAEFGDLTRMGLTAGLAGAAVHFLVDFDVTDPSYRHYFFLSLGALALLSRLEAPSFAGAAVPAAAAIVLFVVALPLAGLIAPRFLEADGHVVNAAVAVSRKEWEDADQYREAADRENPLDVGPAVDRALSEFQRWVRFVERGEPGAGKAHAELAITILEDALQRRPRHASIEARLAEVQEAFARESGRGGSGMEAASAEAVRREAERHARRAVELYPTSADLRYLLGRILDESGQDGAGEFREALRLSSLAVRVPRLALDGLQKAVANLKTGGTLEQAVAIYRERRRRRGGTPLLAPVEKSIVDAAADSK